MVIILDKYSLIMLQCRGSSMHLTSLLFWDVAMRQNGRLMVYQWKVRGQGFPAAASALAFAQRIWQATQSGHSILILASNESEQKCHRCTRYHINGCDFQTPLDTLERRIVALRTAKIQVAFHRQPYTLSTEHIFTQQVYFQSSSPVSFPLISRQ